MKLLQVTFVGLLGLLVTGGAAPTEGTSDIGGRPHHDNKAFTYRCVVLDIQQCDGNGKCAIVETCLSGCNAIGSTTGVVGAVCQTPAHEPHHNDESNTYHCEELNLMECSVLGTCHLYEACEHWCVDLTSPLGAVCADAPNQVEARGPSDAGALYDDTEKYYYVCIDLDVMECDKQHPDVCEVKETCPNGCFQKHDGALCVDRPAPPEHSGKAMELRDEAEATSSKDGPRYWNDGWNTYKCMAGKLMRCTPVNACNLQEWCTWHCIDDSKGGNCINAAVPELTAREDTDVAAVDASQACDDINKKCRKCSNDHRGVLTCQYGFCYVQPGDWCASNASCQDGCACCKKRLKFGKKEGELDGGLTKHKRSGNEVSTNFGECRPGQYTCDHEAHEWILACNYRGKFEHSFYCGKTKEGVGCCIGNADPNPIFGARYCDCRGLPGGPPALETNAQNAATTEIRARSTEIRSDTAIPANCTPGAFECTLAHRFLLVCGADREWQLSADCGKDGACKDTIDGVAHCNPRVLRTD